MAILLSFGVFLVVLFVLFCLETVSFSHSGLGLVCTKDNTELLIPLPSLPKW